MVRWPLWLNAECETRIFFQGIRVGFRNVVCRTELKRVPVKEPNVAITFSLKGEDMKRGVPISLTFPTQHLDDCAPACSHCVTGSVGGGGGGRQRYQRCLPPPASPATGDPVPVVGVPRPGRRSRERHVCGHPAQAPQIPCSGSVGLDVRPLTQ